jgi:hypothetical protein
MKIMFYRFLYSLAIVMTATQIAFEQKVFQIAKIND